MSLNEYILITPVKNEEDSLPLLIKSIEGQTILPALWLIVDDSSVDRTAEIIKAATSGHSWISSITLESQSAYDIEEHYALVCRAGFTYATDYCKSNRIEYEYVCLSDADTIYPNDYFYSMIKFLRDNETFGIVSGKLLIKTSSETYSDSRLPQEISHPYGTGRVWKKQAFDDTGGYIVTKSPDCVSNVMAMIKGWKIGQTNAVFYQLRETGGKESIWRGYYSRGRRAHYIGTNPLSVLNTIADICIISKQKNPLKKSVAYFCGFFISLIYRNKQIDNMEVRRYLGSYRRVLSSYVTFLKSVSGISKKAEDINSSRVNEG